MKSTWLFLSILLLATIFFSCGRDGTLVENIEDLEFDDDTVLFDTVFVSVGSATQVFQIYNRGDETLLLNRVELAGGERSPYRLNFDGVSDVSFTDIELLAGDSMYGFVEVTIDPSSIETPFVVKDSVIFTSGKGQKDLKLVSWGQNAIFHVNDTITQTETWTSQAPHVLYGNNFVKKGVTLTIEEGTQIYGHSLSRLIVKRGASLRVLGSVDFPVVFQGDRKEKRFEEEPGQWFGIHFLPGSVNNYIRYGVIKNAHRGIQVDSMLPSREPNLVVENTSIRSMSQVCVLGYTASIQMINCELIDACEFLFVGELGGNYDLFYCTLGNFQKSCVRTDPSVYLSNADYEDEGGTVFKNKLDFQIANCIVYGGEEDELIINGSGGGEINPVIGNSLLRIQVEDKDLPAWENAGNIINKDPKFVSPGELNYQLDTLSPAIGKALPLGAITTDFFGKPRDGSNPDIGAFERDE